MVQPYKTVQPYRTVQPYKAVQPYKKVQPLTNRPPAQSDADVTQLPTPDSYSVDIEQKVVDEAHLQNTTVHNFTWQGVKVTVKDRKTKQPKVILDGIDGTARAGT